MPAIPRYDCFWMEIACEIVVSLVNVGFYEGLAVF